MDIPAGKIESGEGPEHAAVRETWDETGLRIRAGDVIGSRIHPLTGVPIAYVAATPTSALDVIGGRAAASGRAVRGRIAYRDVSADVSTVSRPRSG